FPLLSLSFGAPLRSWERGVCFFEMYCDHACALFGARPGNASNCMPLSRPPSPRPSPTRGRGRQRRGACYFGSALVPLAPRGRGVGERACASLRCVVMALCLARAQRMHRVEYYFQCPLTPALSRKVRETKGEARSSETSTPGWDSSTRHTTP